MASGAAGPNRTLALAGIQAGVAGTLVLLAYLALDSIWHRRSIWTFANLLASTFYGESAYRQSFGVRTGAGLALAFAIYGVLGLLFGLIVRDHGTVARGTLLGLIYGTAWFFLSFDWIWKHVNPMVALYSPDRAMMIGHLLYGGLMGGSFPVHRRQIGGAQPPEIPPPLLPTEPASSAEN